MRQTYGTNGQGILVEILKTDERLAWLRTYGDKLTIVTSALGGFVYPSGTIRVVKASQSLTGITGPPRHGW